DLREQFTRHFTASRAQPKTEATLEAIYQGREEPLRKFIERFNKEVVQVNMTDDMKRYLLERGLRPRSDFAKVVGIEKPREVADALRHSRPDDNPPPRESNPPPRESSHKEGGRKKNDKSREPRGPPSMFSSYTHLPRAYTSRVRRLGI
ncbi:hypothetical protein A2U01_0049718, partial [Trifolium medium]|nr:hypothetical protein [Trifolium medium]